MTTTVYRKSRTASKSNRNPKSPSPSNETLAEAGTIHPASAPNGAGRPLAFTPCGGGCPLARCGVLVVPDLGGPSAQLAGDLAIVADRGSDFDNLEAACGAVFCSHVRIEEPAEPDRRLTSREKFLRAVAARRRETTERVICGAVRARNNEAKRDLDTIAGIERALAGIGTQLAKMRQGCELTIADTTQEIGWYEARWAAASGRAAKAEADLRASPRPKLHPTTSKGNA